MTTKVLFSPRMLLGVLILLLGIVYGLHSEGDLMFDDEQQIAYVSAFGSLSDTFSVDCFGLFRPVKNLIFYAWVNLLPDDYQLWRLSAIAAFLGLIPLVYVFMRLFYEESSWMPLIATTIWAIAPANTTIVNWISGTNILVCGYGFFIYFLLYERWQGNLSHDSPRHRVPYLLGSLFALGFSCLSYEAAITAPFLLILKDYVKDRERLFQKQTQTFLGLSILIVGAYFYQRSTAGGMTNFALVPTIPVQSDLWVSLSSPWMFIVHAMRWLWPYGQQGMLILFNPEVHKGLVLSATAVLAVIIFVAVWFRDKHPYFFLGLGWYCIALLPMANAVPLRNGPICDYYLIFPSIGLVLLVGWIFEKLKGLTRAPIVPVVVAIWICAFTWTTIRWNSHWTSMESLAERTLAWQPENYVIQRVLAKFATDRGDYEAAETLLEEAIGRAPWYDELHYQKAMLLTQTKRYSEAVEKLQQLRIAQPNLAKPLVFIAYIKDVHLGLTAEAEKLLVQAMEKGWDNKYSKTGAMNLAAIYIKTNRVSFAEGVYSILLDRYPNDPEIEELRSSLTANKQDL